MVRRLILMLTFTTLGLLPAVAQLSYAGFTDTLRMLRSARGEALDRLLNALNSEGKVPLVRHDSVAFLYRGDAGSVAWMGDFNGWGNDRTFQNKGTRVPGTDLWILKASLPADARLDYKIVLDGSNWILDPLNPATQWSGVGGGSPNSELRMPGWKEVELPSLPLPDARRGRVEKDILFNSSILKYQITYSVYLPRQFAREKKHGILYVTDGYEFLHERMGNMAAVLDHLIDAGKIRPVVVVFVDHREPVNRSQNRRMIELAMNRKYLDFFLDELLPEVEGRYGAPADGESRGILGTSLGGLSAAYFSCTKPEVFGLSGMLSPAFWFKPEIYTMADSPAIASVRMFLATGVIHDAAEGSRKMKPVLEAHAREVRYVEINQGHSWGNWKSLLDDILIYFFAAD